jgi:hypothetical protein
MKKQSKLLVLFSVVLVLSFSTFLSESMSFMRGDIDNDDKVGLPESINALQVASGLKSAIASKIINVPTDIPTIQQAIDAASEGDTINIAAGTYNENLNIEKDNIKLQGAGRDITVINGNSTDSTMELKNAKNIEVKDCSFSNGVYGIYLINSSLECTDVAIDSNSRGLRITFNSYVCCENTSIKNNSGRGADVRYNSSGRFNYCEIKNNNGIGLESGHSSFVYVYNSKISNNSETGIMAVMDGCMAGDHNEIKSNGGVGIDITCNSSGGLYGNNSIIDNYNGGISIYHNSYCITNATDDISQNHGQGILVSNNSTVGINGSSINNNMGDGVIIEFGCTSGFQGATIHGNSGYGINCKGGYFSEHQPIDFGSQSAGTLNTLGNTNNCY